MEEMHIIDLSNLKKIFLTSKTQPAQDDHLEARLKKDGRQETQEMAKKTNTYDNNGTPPRYKKSLKA